MYDPLDLEILKKEATRLHGHGEVLELRIEQIKGANI